MVTGNGDLFLNNDSAFTARKRSCGTLMLSLASGGSGYVWGWVLIPPTRGEGGVP